MQDKQSPTTNDPTSSKKPQHTVLLSEELMHRLSEEVKHTPEMEPMTLDERVEAALKQWLAMKESGRRAHHSLLHGYGYDKVSEKPQVTEKPKRPMLVRRAPSSDKQ
jgi:hypothetical protein